MLGFKSSPRQAAQKEVQALFQDIHGIADPKKKEEMIQDFLWRMLAPLHDMRNADDLDKAMKNLWATALVKSIFGLKEVENRLRDFTRNKNQLLGAMSGEGIGLMIYLLTSNPDTFGRLIEEATVKLNHGRRRKNYTNVMILEEEYSLLFSGSAQVSVAS